jgi:hypothetical protein
MEADHQGVDLGMRDPRHHLVERSPIAQRSRKEPIIILRATFTLRSRGTLTYKGLEMLEMLEMLEIFASRMDVETRGRWLFVITARSLYFKFRIELVTTERKYFFDA